MKYDDYQLKDFVDDTFFNEWVKNPDQESNLFWKNWLERHPDKEELIEEAKQLVLFLHFEASLPVREDFLEVKANIKNQIQQERANISYNKLVAIKNGPAFFIRTHYRVAAVVTGFLIICSALYFFVLQTAPATYETSFGETRTVLLPDGSTVIVNANSSIRFANNWKSDTDREVWLTGEAYFDVLKKNSNTGGIKFIVHTEDLNVEVLGTTFNVKNRRGIVKVVLNTGKVKINQSGETKKALLMKPGELVEFSQKDNGFTKKKVKPENYSSWRYNKLVFEEATVREIAQILEDDYGVKVTFAHEAIANRIFTGSVPKGNIHILLTVLAESLNISITQNSDEITFNYK